MRIADISPEDRPREKMMRLGASVLTGSELLAIIIRTGSGRKNAIELAQEVLSAGGGLLSGVLALGTDGLRTIPGIGRDKAVSILAALEIGRRFFVENSGVDVRHITSPEDIYRLMIPLMKNLPHEEAWGIFLSRKHRIIKQERLTVGTGGATLVDNAEIIRRAIACKSSAFILVHNHPGGSPEPGKQDILMTESLQRALEVMDIKMLDHVIVSDGCFFSFSDERLGRM